MSASDLTVIQPQRRVERARSAEWLRVATGADALLALARLDGRRGAIAITTGVLADSIALVGFGIDSAIEGFASIIIIWRLSGWRLLSHAAEERAQKLVAIQFFLRALCHGRGDPHARRRAYRLEPDRDAGPRNRYAPPR